MTSNENLSSSFDLTKIVNEIIAGDEEGEERVTASLATPGQTEPQTSTSSQQQREVSHEHKCPADRQEHQKFKTISKPARAANENPGHVKEDLRQNAEEEAVIKPRKNERPQKPIKSSRRFPCPHCDLVLTTRPNRRKHIMIHTGERPFVCEVCGIGKITRTELKRHMMTHTHQNEHFCGLCGNAFFCQNSVKRHVRSVHKTAPERVELYRVHRFTEEGTGQDMVKLKVVKNGRNYYKTFKVFKHQMGGDVDVKSLPGQRGLESSETQPLIFSV